MVENVTTPGARSLTLTIRGDAANGADWWGESSGTVPHQDEGFPFWSVNAAGDRLVAAGVRSDGQGPASRTACQNAAGQTFGCTKRGGDRGEPVRHGDQAMAATSPTATA